MMQRVPDWQPTSEADLDQVLIDLIAADADELADYQDRVMNEAYFATARKRVSLARYARLMDYHIHEGNQGSTWLAVKVSLDHALAPEFGVWTGEKWSEPGSIIFASETAQTCYALLNDLSVYGWDDTVSAIEAGSTEADLTTKLEGMSKSEAEALRDVFLSSDVHHLLIQQELNPETGTINGRDPGARQVMQLLPLGGTVPRAEIIQDPRPDPNTAAERWMVRVRWRAEDALQRCYPTVTRCDGKVVTSVSKFYGNLVRVTHGRPHETEFHPPGDHLPGADDSTFVGKDSAYFETLDKQVGTERPVWGTALPLSKAPLAFRDTQPGGDEPTRSTLRVSVSGSSSAWDEQSDLIESDGGRQHFIVETDELGANRVRFGDGINGAALPENAVVTCHYRVGQGESGNVGGDKLIHFNDATVTATWNPLDVIDGRSPAAAGGNHPRRARGLSATAEARGDARRLRRARRGVTGRRARARALRLDWKLAHRARRHRSRRHRRARSRARPRRRRSSRRGAADWRGPRGAAGAIRAARHQAQTVRRPGLLARGFARRARDRVLRRLHAGRPPRLLQS